MQFICLEGIGIYAIAALAAGEPRYDRVFHTTCRQSEQLGTLQSIRLSATAAVALKIGDWKGGFRKAVRLDRFLFYQSVVEVAEFQASRYCGLTQW